MDQCLYSKKLNHYLMYYQALKEDYLIKLLFTILYQIIRFDQELLLHLINYLNLFLLYNHVARPFFSSSSVISIFILISFIPFILKIINNWIYDSQSDTHKFLIIQQKNPKNICKSRQDYCNATKEIKNIIELRYFRTLKYQFISLQVLIGWNENGGIEIQKHNIYQNLAIIEHKFNCFILQFLSDDCYYEWKNIGKDRLIIMDENDKVQFKNQQLVWEYQLVFVNQDNSKNQDSQQKIMIQAGIQQDDNFFRNTLKCGICFEILQRPVQIQCKHCFCGYCITLLQRSSSKCPTCRADIKQTTFIDSLNKLTQLYLRKHPSKAKSIEQQELYEADNRYYDECMNNYSHYESDSSQKDQQLRQPRCQSCLQSYKQYVCKPNQQHIQCCNYLLPIRHLNARKNQQYKLFCQICKRYTCGYYYNNDCTQEIIDLSLWSQYMIKDSQDFLDQKFLIKIQQYLKGLPIDYLFTYVIQNFVKKELFYFEGQQSWIITNQNELILSGSPLCFECMKDVAPQMVIKFFEHNRISENEIPNCENGIHCQQIYEDEEHDRRYNHFCRRQV
ncbi:hypothetical protein pb186bvf_015265 [Paramecium bursaria]